MRTFFALPEADKLRIDKRNSRHFEGGNRSGPSRPTTVRTSASRSICGPSGPPRDGDVEPPYLRLLGPNQWLPDAVLPGHRELILAWFRELGVLADRLLRLLSEALGLTPDHLSNYFGDEPMSLTKLISYPPTPAGGAGVNAHHDTGFLTVLAAGTTPGLQAENTDGDWIDVPVVPDSFVINLGEIMQAITGNYFVATPHRVITAEPRLSAGYFHGPSLDTRLDPLPLDSRFAEAVAVSPRHRDAGLHGRSRRDRGGRRRHAQHETTGHRGEPVVELLRPELPR